MIYAGILAGGTGSRMGITDMPKTIFWIWGGRPILIHTVEKFLLVHEIQKIVLGIHPDWVTYTEDLVDKYLASYKERILVVEGGSDRNSTIENIIKAIDKVQPLTDEDIIVTHDSVRPFVSLKTIQENIELAKSHAVVDTVVEATDTIVQSLDNTFITDIPERANNLYQGSTLRPLK